MRVTPASVVVACALLVVFVVACFVLCLKVIRTTVMCAKLPRRLLCAGVSVSFVVLAAEMIVLRTYASDLPYWDQWEQGALFVSLQSRALTWAQLFQPHGEHPIFFSRLLSLGLLVENHQWDNRLQTVVDATLHAGTAALLLFAVLPSVRRRDVTWVTLTVIFTNALPFARENVVWGFQSCFYFHALFSLIALILLVSAPPGSRAWFAGVLSLWCAVVSLAAGLLTALVVLTAVGARMLASPLRWRRQLPTLVASGAALGLGLTLAAKGVQANNAFKAQSASDFLISFSRGAAWPFVDHPLMATVLWCPLVILAWLRLQSTAERPRLPTFIEALGLWVLLHDAAMAYARGQGGGPPATRYMDILGIGVTANTAAALMAKEHFSSRFPRAGAVAFGLWLTTIFLGGSALAWTTLSRDIPAFAEVTVHQVENVRRFIVSGDMVALENKPPLHVPYPDPVALASMLSSAPIRAILPGSVREPIRLVPVSISAFALNAVPQEIPTDELAPAFGTAMQDSRARPAYFRSQVLSARSLRYLKISIALGPIGDDTWLKLVGQRDEILVPLSRARRAAGWTTETVKRPAGVFQVVAQDASAQGWLAFREPIEVGLLTYWSERALYSGPWLMCVGVAVGLVAFFSLADHALQADADPRAQSQVATNAPGVQGPLNGTESDSSNNRNQGRFGHDVG
jgi:hypothetical protein